MKYCRETRYWWLQVKMCSEKQLAIEREGEERNMIMTYTGTDLFQLTSINYVIIKGITY